MKKLMLRLVRTARKAFEADARLREIGYETTPYWDIYCEVSDAIYDMLGENTETLNDEQRVLILISAYNKKNRPALA